MSALLGTCNPRRSCPACLPATYYILLLPFMRVVQHLVRLSIAFTRLCHSCLPDTRLFPHPGQINATRCEAVSSLPLSSYKPCTPHVLLCSRHGACQSCLTDAWCVFLLPSRSYAIRVCPTLSCSFSWIRHLARINATRCEAVCSLCRCF